MAVPAGPAVVLTREPEDNRELAAELARRGIPVREIPCLATRYHQPAEVPGRADAVVFTSRRGVKGLLLLPGRIRLLSVSPPPLLCAVGKATAEAIQAGGLGVDIIADPPTGEVLAQALTARLPAGRRILLVRGNLRAGGLDEALERAGYEIVGVEVYENSAPDVPAVAPFPVAAVFAASPSAARRLLEANPWLRERPFVGIGPTTEKALRELGVGRVVVAGTRVAGKGVAGMEAAALADALCGAAAAHRESNAR